MENLTRREITPERNSTRKMKRENGQMKKAKEMPT